MTQQQGMVRAIGTELDVERLGDVFARSGYFKDASDSAKAIVKILYGRELGMPPVASMLGIHIIEGKPTLSAQALATLVRRSGRYDYRVRQSDATAAVIDFYLGGEKIGDYSFTIEEAKTAGLTGDSRPIWKRYPKAMLFNRAMAAGVRMHCPDLLGGAPIYDPDELEVDADGEPVANPAQARVEQLRENLAGSTAEASALAQAEPALTPAPEVVGRTADGGAITMTRNPSPPAEDPPANPTCTGADCGRPLTKGQAMFSARAYGRPLCPTCQSKHSADRDAAAPTQGDQGGDWKRANARAHAEMNEAGIDVQNRPAVHHVATVALNMDVTSLGLLSAAELDRLAEWIKRQPDAAKALAEAIAA